VPTVRVRHDAPARLTGRPHLSRSHVPKPTHEQPSTVLSGVGRPELFFFFISLTRCDNYARRGARHGCSPATRTQRALAVALQVYTGYNSKPFAPPNWWGAVRHARRAEAGSAMARRPSGIFAQVLRSRAASDARTVRVLVAYSRIILLLDGLKGRLMLWPAERYGDISSFESLYPHTS